MNLWLKKGLTTNFFSLLSFVAVFTYLVILGPCLPMIQLESLRKSQVPVVVFATGCHSRPSPIRRFPPYLLGGFYRQFWSSVHFLHFLSPLGPSSSHPQLYLRRNACVDLSGLFENAGSGGQLRTPSCLDPGSGMGKNQDPGSGINIPDPQHWI